MSEITGSCLCGKVHYRLQQDIGDIVHCHCIKCRKAHASAFSSVAKIDDVNFDIQGEHNLTSFQSSPDKLRYFCSHCGSQIYAKRDNTDFLILRLGTLNEASLLKSQYQESKHIWLAEKACWYQLGSEIEKRQEY